MVLRANVKDAMEEAMHRENLSPATNRKLEIHEQTLSGIKLVEIFRRRERERRRKEKEKRRGR